MVAVILSTTCTRCGRAPVPPQPYHLTPDGHSLCARRSERVQSESAYQCALGHAHTFMSVAVLCEESQGASLPAKH